MAEYRKTTIEDLEEIAELETEAFFDYPLYWDVLRKKFKNDTEYRKFLKLILTVELTVDLKRGNGYVGMVNDEIASVALIHSLEDKQIGFFELMEAGAIKLFPYVFKCKLWSYLKELDRAESKSVEPSKSPTWYLSILAVNPKYQQRHLGSEMIQDCLLPMLREHDARRVTLMTNTKTNCYFYEKNGFAISSHIRLNFGKGQVENWSFQRLL
ncbi:GNAT family N-acetyltransferase [Companilactobacillus jidongensis]|uniref:GNAT family N-acetyltransferase n=1 Tax=Companilactobacillus jidongensis TaxID=2486006 RepID=UPI000F780C44|nr:GNAT family N-acetyltransferase [Companilactobacillus jidongensis]